MPHGECVAEVSEQVAGLSPSRLSPIAGPTFRVAPRPKSTSASNRIDPGSGLSHPIPVSTGLGAELAVETVTENDTASTAEGEGNRVQSLFPVLISFGIHGGYDDNFRTTPNPSGSWFTDEQLTLAYDRTRGPTKLSIFSGVGAVERPGQDTEENGFLDLSLSHRATQRLTLGASIDAAYRSEPDFSSNIGPNRRAGNYFSMADALSAAYQWSRRFSTVSSYSLLLIRYEDSFTAAFTDREEHTLGEEFRFHVLRDTVLVADYRFLVVDYVSLPRDSVTHFALAGIEQSFSQRLQAQIRAGASFRSFDQGGDQVDPEFEGSLNYSLGRHSSIKWTIRYSVEEPAAPETLSQTTFRTGLQFRYGFTPRISSAIGFDYHHDESQPGNAIALTGPDSSTDAYDLLLSLRYQISRHVDLDIGFEHSEANSADPIQEYSRNRYSIGLNFTF